MPRPTPARTAWLIAALAALTGVLGILAVLAPVTADDPVVSWPRAGEAPTSTVLPLSPYRPLQLDATVPCSTLRDLDARGGGAALRTMPADAGEAAAEGLLVQVQDGVVAVTASGVELAEEPLPAGDCTYRVAAGAAGVQLSRDGTPLADRPVLPPQVAQLATDVTGPAEGLAVELHTDARYESSPTALKIALLVAHAVALAALLVLAWRRWGGSGPGLVRPRPGLADAAVLLVSLGWVLLGPMNIDDSWYLLMAHNAMESGYIGNYIYQFNVTENPFSTSQYVMQAWGGLGGWGLAWMRVLPLVYGLATYALLRVLVATVLGRVSRAVPVAWALAFAHLMWWLPYGITLRPEPMIALGAAGVLVLAELARRRESLGVLAAATAVAVLTVTAAPTGLVAAAPLLLALPWLLRRLRAAGTPERIGAVLLAGAAASVVVLPGFADATLGDVLESTAVHRWYYRQYSWYAEFFHYSTLLDISDTGAWGKRLPVLMTLAVLLGALIASGRRGGTGGPVGRLLAGAAALTAISLALLALTPTKWVNHFGAVAAPATVLVAMAMLRSPVPRRSPTVALTLAGLGTVTAAAVSFAGPNLWRPFTDWGQPFGDHTNLDTPVELVATAPALGPLALRNPLLWLAVAGAALWWARRRRSPLTADRGVLVTATGLGVALMLAVFVIAPVRQFPGPSVASMNTQALLSSFTPIGDPCGLADGVDALIDASPGLGAPRGGAEVTGDLREQELPGSRAPEGTAWHGADGEGTGSLRTGWYPIPGSALRPGSGATIALPTAGERSGDQEIALQFRTPRGTRAVELPPANFAPEWSEFITPVPEGATAVRVTATDRLAGPESWIAVAEPRLLTPKPVGELIGAAPVFADQASAVLWPCTDKIAITNGIAEVPEYRLRTGDGFEPVTEENSIFAPNGGTLVQLDRTAEFVEIPSRLSPPGAPTLQWGHVERVVTDHPVGLVDLRVEQERRWGWVRLPTLRGEPYTGRLFIG